MSATEREYHRLQRVSRQMTTLIWAARLLRLVSAFVVLAAIVALFGLSDPRGNVVVNGMRVTGVGGLCALLPTAAVMILLLWALAAQFEATVAILEDQHDIRLRLERQDRMLKVIGKAAQVKDDTQHSMPQ